MSRQIITARVERIGDSHLYRVVVNHDGAIVLTDETYTVCSRVADALVNPQHEIGTECGEVADTIREAYNHGKV